MRHLSILILGTFMLAACSSTDEPGPGSSASGGSAGSGGGSAGTGGSTGGSGGTGGEAGGNETGGADVVDGSSADTAEPGSGGAPADGGEVDTGASTDAPAAGGFTCNAVLGIHTTAEWFDGGFETYVDNARWEIIDNHPGYVANWAIATDPIWSTAPASPCTTNATNPDRVVFNAYADQTVTTYTTKAEWVTGLTNVVANLKSKYSNLKRIDLLTMTRAPQ